MDNKCKKRERNTNYTRDEVEKLISLVEKYKLVIENKKSDAVTWQEKEKAWNAIEVEFNSATAGTFRNAKHLKIKYEAIKRDTRKKSSVIRAELYKTGGGTNNAVPLTPVEEKVKEMILLSVEGGESIYDSDQLEVIVNEESEPGVQSAATGHQITLEEPSCDTICNIIVSEELETGGYSSAQEQQITQHATTSENLICSNNVGFQIPIEAALTKKIPSPPQPEEAMEPKNKCKWAEWKPASLKSKKTPALCIKSKKPFEKLADAKLELTALQEQVLKEELAEKILKQELLKQELAFKRELHEMDKKFMELKIKLLEMEIKNKKI